MTPVWHGHRHRGSREEPTELRDLQEALIFPYTVRSKSITFVSVAFQAVQAPEAADNLFSRDMSYLLVRLASNLWQISSPEPAAAGNCRTGLRACNNIFCQRVGMNLVFISKTLLVTLHTVQMLLNSCFSAAVQCWTTTNSYP